MKKFIADHPIFSVFLSSCFTCFTISALTVLGFIGTIVILGFAIAGSPNELPQTYSYIEGNKLSTNKILVVPVEGVILTTESSNDIINFFNVGYTYGYSIKNDLVKASNDDSIKAIVLDINSPGGTITGAKAISDGVAYYKNKTGRPVIAYTSELAASGGYWSAVSADKIVADYGTLVGSIGVIMGPFKYYNKVLSEGDISTENGIESYYFTAGTDKDFGDPYKKVSSKAKTAMQKGIDNEYETFVNYVSSRRGIDTDTIKNKVGALAYDTTQAQELSLVDFIGDVNVAYNYAASSAKLKDNDYQVISIKTNGFWDSIMASSMLNAVNKRSAPKQECILCNKMLFIYGDPKTYEN